MVNYYRAKKVRITGGTGAGQIRQIASNTSGRVATISPAWTTTPDNTSTYEVGPSNVQVSNNTIISRTTGDLTSNAEIFRIQGNGATEVNVFGNTFTRAGNTSTLTRFINPAHDVLGKIHDNTCYDPSIICVNISNTQTRAKIYNNNDSAHVRADTSTSYTATITDDKNIRTMSNTSPITVTLPNNLPVGWSCPFIQVGAGQITFSAGPGATVNNGSSVFKTSGQNSVGTPYVTSNTNGTNAVYRLVVSDVKAGTLTDSGAVNWDTAAIEHATVTLAGNRTMAAPTNLTNGKEYILYITFYYTLYFP
jgi:hypothetical protein